MSNYFEFQNFANVQKDKIGLSVDKKLQKNSELEQLRYGVNSFAPYASFGVNEYITSKPKKLLAASDKLGVMTNSTSSANGVTVTVDLMKNYTVPAVTVWYSQYAPHEIVITLYDENGNELTSAKSTPPDDITTDKMTIAANSQGVRKAEIYVAPQGGHFTAITRIEMGALMIFDSSNLISAEVNTYFSVDGSTIEYDTANLQIFSETGINTLLKKQPVVYKNESGEVINIFYVEESTSQKKEDNVSTLKAYDCVAKLENSKFLGGKYSFSGNIPYSTEQLINDILSDSRVEYEISGDLGGISGYIPITTKRKALSMVCQGANVRCFKSKGKLYFMPFSESNNLSYAMSDTVSTNISELQALGKLTIKERNYSIGHEEVELYNWYLQQGENTEEIVEFSDSVWKVTPYEVVGVDENGNDVISDTPSTNITFLEYPTKTNTICNYVKVGRQNTKNKIILKGYKLKENTKSVIAERDILDENFNYREIEISDMNLFKATEGTNSIKMQTQEVANLLFAIEATKSTQTLSVLSEKAIPKSGDNVNTWVVTSPIDVSVKDRNGKASVVSRNMKISSVKDDLTGLYTVVIE